MQVGLDDTLLLHLDFFDIHGIFSLLIESFKLEFNSELQLLLVQCHRIIKVCLDIVVASIVFNEIPFHHNLFSLLNSSK